MLQRPYIGLPLLPVLAVSATTRSMTGHYLPLLISRIILVQSASKPAKMRFNYGVGVERNLPVETLELQYLPSSPFFLGIVFCSDHEFVRSSFAVPLKKYRTHHGKAPVDMWVSCKLKLPVGKPELHSVCALTLGFRRRYLLT